MKRLPASAVAGLVFAGCLAAAFGTSRAASAAVDVAVETPAQEGTGEKGSRRERTGEAIQVGAVLAIVALGIGILVRSIRREAGEGSPTETFDASPPSPRPEGVPKATIIIPAHDDEKTIDEVLSGVLALAPSPEHEVVVVDDASTDGTAARVSQVAGDRVRLVRNEKNLGLAASMNRALAEAQGEFIVVLQSDCAIRDPGWLAAMLEPLEDPRVGVVVSRRSIEGRENLPLGARVFNAVCPQDLAGASRTAAAPSGPEQIEFFRGKADAYRTDLLRRLGGWDSETFFLAGEDTDLSLRMRKIGFQIVLSERARVTMLFSSRQDTVRGALAKALVYGAAAYPLYSRHGYDGIQARTYLLCLATLGLSPLLFQGAPGIALSIVLAAFAFRTRFAIVRARSAVPFAAIPLAFASMGLLAWALAGPLAASAWLILPAAVTSSALAYPLYVAAKAAAREARAAPGVSVAAALPFAFAWRLLSGVGYALGWARARGRRPAVRVPDSHGGDER